MKPTNIRVIYETVEPHFEVCEYAGERLVLTGPLAFLYRGFKVMKGEETAQRELAPWLNAELMKSGAISPEHAAPSLNEGTK